MIVKDMDPVARMSRFESRLHYFGKCSYINLSKHLNFNIGKRKKKQTKTFLIEL